MEGDKVTFSKARKAAVLRLRYACPCEQMIIPQVLGGTRKGVGDSRTRNNLPDVAMLVCKGGPLFQKTERYKLK